MELPSLRPPQALNISHRLSDFSCGQKSLDEWLHRRAMSNQLSGASKTFVITDQEERVLGFYALANGAISHALATKAIARNMPDPIPVMVLGRLAVAKEAQGMHLGAALLKDAVCRTLAVAEHAGIRALLVHALNEEAKRFYTYFGFEASPVNPMTLMMRLSAFRKEHQKA